MPSSAGGHLDSWRQIEGNNAFALKLFQAIRNQSGNLFYSPYSISLAFAMLYAGTGSDTESQIANVMQFNLPQEDLHATFNSIDAELASRGQTVEDEGSEQVKLNIANAMWGESSCSFSPDYLDTLVLNYGAGLRLINFSGAPDGSRQTINKWVEDRTENRIKDLIPPGGIDSSTVLALTNAIYFDAAWQHSFPADYTNDQEFTLIDGSTIRVPMMNQINTLKYTEGHNFQALELPYAGEELSMLVLLPREGRFKEFEESLNADLVRGMTESISLSDVALFIPKFEFESRLGLGGVLKGMGMRAPFGSGADFSRMGVECLHGGAPRLSGAFHKGFVLVEEEGTEAAAATALTPSVSSGGFDVTPPPVPFIADRPFIFLIRDNPTGSILFVGRVMDPR